MIKSAKKFGGPLEGIDPTLTDLQTSAYPLDQWQVLKYCLPGTIYRPRDENFFLQLEGCFGFPHYSNYRTTKRKVCLRPGTEILGTGNLFC